jgi:hypothetical protein
MTEDQVEQAIADLIERYGIDNRGCSPTVQHVLRVDNTRWRRRTRQQRMTESHEPTPMRWVVHHEIREDTVLVRVEGEIDYEHRS